MNITIPKNYQTMPPILGNKNANVNKFFGKIDNMNEKIKLNERIIQLTSRDEDGNTILHRLIINSLNEDEVIGKIKLIPEIETLINNVNNKGQTSLHLICKNQYYEVFKLLKGLSIGEREEKEAEEINEVIDVVIDDDAKKREMKIMIPMNKSTSKNEFNFFAVDKHNKIPFMYLLKGVEKDKVKVCDKDKIKTNKYCLNLVEIVDNITNSNDTFKGKTKERLFEYGLKEGDIDKCEFLIINDKLEERFINKAFFDEYVSVIENESNIEKFIEEYVDNRQMKCFVKNKNLITYEPNSYWYSICNYIVHKNKSIDDNILFLILMNNVFKKITGNSCKIIDSDNFYYLMFDYMIFCCFMMLSRKRGDTIGEIFNVFNTITFEGDNVKFGECLRDEYVENKKKDNKYDEKEKEKINNAIVKKCIDNIVVLFILIQRNGYYDYSMIVDYLLLLKEFIFNSIEEDKLTDENKNIFTHFKNIAKNIKRNNYVDDINILKTELKYITRDNNEIDWKVICEEANRKISAAPNDWACIEYKLLIRKLIDIMYDKKDEDEYFKKKCSKMVYDIINTADNEDIGFNRQFDNDTNLNGFNYNTLKQYVDVFNAYPKILEFINVDNLKVELGNDINAPHPPGTPVKKPNEFLKVDFNKNKIDIKKTITETDEFCTDLIDDTNKDNHKQLKRLFKLCKLIIELRNHIMMQIPKDYKYQRIDNKDYEKYKQMNDYSIVNFISNIVNRRLIIPNYDKYVNKDGILYFNVFDRLLANGGITELNDYHDLLMIKKISSLNVNKNNKGWKAINNFITSYLKKYYDELNNIINNITIYEDMKYIDDIEKINKIKKEINEKTMKTYEDKKIIINDLWIQTKMK